MMFDYRALSPVIPGGEDDGKEFYHYTKEPMQFQCDKTDNFVVPQMYDNA
jgi:hypothetical protein